VWSESGRKGGKSYLCCEVKKGYLACLYLRSFGIFIPRKWQITVWVMNHNVPENNHSTFLSGMNFQIVKATDCALPLPYYGCPHPSNSSTSGLSTRIPRVKY
jgi:hypothetical protein